MFVKIAAAGALVAAVAGGAVVTADPFGTETAAPTVRTSTEVQAGGARNDAHPKKVGEAPEPEGELMNGFAANDGAVPGQVQTWGGDLNVRSGAGTDASVVSTLGNTSPVTIVCQMYGGWVDGYYGSSNIWNKIGDGQYISDAFTYTGSNGIVAPLCSDNPPVPQPGDTQTRTVGDTWDANYFEFPQCTWGASEKFHAFSGYYPQLNGDAHAWNESARDHGWTVSGTPETNSIVVFEAWTNGTGDAGHVAWVTAVDHRADGDYITIEETNWGNSPEEKRSWNTRTVKHDPASMSYILAPGR